MELISPLYVVSVLLVFVRVGGVLTAAPIFGQSGIPVQLRVLLGVLLAYSLVHLAGPMPDWVLHPVGFVVAVGMEAATGLTIGFAAKFVTYVLQVAAEVMGFQMGLTMSQAFNPISGHTENAIGRLVSSLFMLLFLLFDGHHHVIEALALSFRAIPLATAGVAAAGPLLLSWMGMLFETAIRLAAPFMVTLFTVDLVLAVYARTSPQADVFSLSFILKLGVGMVLLILVIPKLGPDMAVLVDLARTYTRDMVGALAG